ncbi:MAG TPA: hypothetical protein VKU41_18750 [Polyangiaceae bacterium]|nr:hypothetical protein [Polyangiaceae bacterium]
MTAEQAVGFTKALRQMFEKAVEMSGPDSRFVVGDVLALMDAIEAGEVDPAQLGRVAGPIPLPKLSRKLS